MDLPRHAMSIAVLVLLPAWMIVAETPKTTRKKTATVNRTSNTGTKKSGAGYPAKSSSTAGKAAPTTASRTTSASTRKGTTAARSRPTAAPRRPVYQRQMQPTPERYKEIQQALVSRGYLKSDPSGTWDQETMDAMRRFQEDQNIEPTGKIDSLSLIALGLGPKHDITARAPAVAEPKPESARPAAN